MKRVLCFILLFYSTVFIPWQAVAILACIYAFYFKAPFELLFLGFLIDGVFYTSSSVKFTLGIFAAVLISEILKILVDRKSLFGIAVVNFLNLTAFAVVYLLV